MARRHAHRAQIITAFVRRPEALEPGKVRCAACSAVVGLTKNGKIRQHQTPAGEPCAHRATYAPPVRLDELPEVVIPPQRAEVNPSAPRAPQARPASRLDAGSECQDCGRWLPGERIVCGKCARKRAESRGRKD